MKKILVSPLLISLSFLFSLSVAQKIPKAQKQQAAPVGISPEKALKTVNTRFDDTKTVAQALFNPVFPNSNPAKQNPYPTSSINEAAVEKMYGSAGLKSTPICCAILKISIFILNTLRNLNMQR